MPDIKSPDHAMRVYYAEAKSRMVRKILAIGYTLRWDQPRNSAEVGMEPKVLNMNHVNDFFLTRGTIRKKITDMTYSELIGAVGQMEALQRDTLNKI